MSKPEPELGAESGAEPGIALRALVASDLDCILCLARETAEAPHWSRQEYEQITQAEPYAVFDRAGFVAHSGCTLAGFAVTSFSRLEKFAEIETIVVHPRFRRRGIGAQLLIAAKAFAQNAGATHLRLEVRESNLAAIALYFAHGFQTFGRRNSYYSAPVEDALLLELSFEAFPEAGRR